MASSERSGGRDSSYFLQEGEALEDEVLAVHGLAFEAVVDVA